MSSNIPTLLQREDYQARHSDMLAAGIMNVPLIVENDPENPILVMR